MSDPLLMDYGGPIEEIALCNPVGLAHTALVRAHRNLLAALPPEVVVKLVCRPEDVTALERWLRRIGRDNAELVPATGRIGPDAIWIQDPFMVTRGARGRPGYISIVAEHDYDYAGWLAAVDGRPVTRSRIGLTGGNMLVGRDFRLVGADSITGGPVASPKRSSRALARHKALDDRPLYIYGHREGLIPAKRGRLWQTPFHIDLALALTGCRTVRGEPIVLLGQPAWRDHGLDRAAERLREDGFFVLRNRLPGKDMRLRYSNNVLVENVVRAGETAPLVFVPTYGRADDTRVLAVWEALGFTPRLVGNWSFGLFPGGALRCASKVLKRHAAPKRERVISDDVLAEVGSWSG